MHLGMQCLFKLGSLLARMTLLQLVRRLNLQSGDMRSEVRRERVFKSGVCCHGTHPITGEDLRDT